MRARDLQPLAPVELRELSAEVPLPLRAEAPRRDGVDRGLRGQARARGARAPLQGGAAEPLPVARARAAPVPRAVDGALRRRRRCASRAPRTGPSVYRENGERCLTNYYRRALPLRRATRRSGSSSGSRFALDASGAYRLQGVIDRVVRARDGAIEIHDFKTGQRVPTPEGARPRSPARALPDRRRREVRRRTSRSAWSGTTCCAIRCARRRARPRRCDELRAQTIELIDAIRAEQKFEPRPSALCGWCEFAEICPASGRQRARRRRPPPRRRPRARSRCSSWPPVALR